MWRVCVCGAAAVRTSWVGMEEGAEECACQVDLGGGGQGRGRGVARVWADGVGLNPVR